MNQNSGSTPATSGHPLSTQHAALSTADALRPRYSFADVLRLHAEFTLDGWFSGGERTLYAFTHMSQFFPHAILQRAGPVAELPVESSRAPVVADASVTTRLGNSTFDAYVQHPESGVDGALVVRGGRIIYESYPRMQPLEKHLLMSVSKAYASTLLALLEARGQLDIARGVETYIPELRGSGWEGVSVRDVLDMTSGIDALEQDADAFSNTEHPYYDYEASLGTTPPTARTPASTYLYTAALKRGRAPGEAFEYTSVDTFVLSWVCERVTGRAYSDLLAAEIWSKIGAEADGLMRVSSVGAAASDGGISATLRDVARFGLLFTPSRAVVAAEPVLPAGLIERIRRDSRPEMFWSGDGVRFSESYGADRPLHNGWQWDAVWPDGDFYKGGMGGQGLHVSPSRDVVVAFFGTPDNQGRRNDLKGLSRRIATLL